MNHSLSASASAFREFNSLRCAVSTTFFLVFVKFFHRSGEAVFVSAVREATQSSTACQQLFPLFDFFFHSTRCRRREVRTYSFPPSLSTTFFQLSKNSFSTFRQPVVSAHSLYLSNSRPGRPLSASARSEKRLWALSRQRSRSFFDFFHDSFLPCHFNMLKRRFLTPPRRPTSFSSDLSGGCAAHWPAFAVARSRTTA